MNSLSLDYNVLHMHVVLCEIKTLMATMNMYA
jgi:hypothetical protein